MDINGSLEFTYHMVTTDEDRLGEVRLGDISVCTFVIDPFADDPVLWLKRHFATSLSTALWMANPDG